MCKKYLILNKNLQLITKEKKNYFEFTSISSNFLGDSQKTAKLFLNDIFNIVGCHFVIE